MCAIGQRTAIAEGTVDATALIWIEKVQLIACNTSSANIGCGASGASGGTGGACGGIG